MDFFMISGLGNGWLVVVWLVNQMEYGGGS